MWWRLYCKLSGIFLIKIFHTVIITLVRSFSRINPIHACWEGKFKTTPNTMCLVSFKISSRNSQVTKITWPQNKVGLNQKINFPSLILSKCLDFPGTVLELQKTFLFLIWYWNALAFIFPHCGKQFKVVERSDPTPVLFGNSSLWMVMSSGYL